MSDRQTQLSNWPRSFLMATALAILLLALLYTLALDNPPSARAQAAGTLSMAITKQLDGSPVVTVRPIHRFHDSNHEHRHNQHHQAASDR